MKICNTCKEDKPLSEYNNNGSYKGRQKLKSHCKTCEHNNRLDRFLTIVKEIFGKLECNKCGYDKCFAALDFHHVDDSTKEFNPSKLRYYAEAVIKEELGKCIILCANCHREHHHG